MEIFQQKQIIIILTKMWMPTIMMLMMILKMKNIVSIIVYDQSLNKHTNLSVKVKFLIPL